VSALLIFQASVLRKEGYKAYEAAVLPLIETFGGRLRATGTQLEVLEGAHDGRRLAAFEFPSMDAIRAFSESSQYKDVRKLREGAARIDMWAVPAP
jgi:uncharacterized protein (DUF1330 family)